MRRSLFILLMGLPLLLAGTVNILANTRVLTRAMASSCSRTPDSELPTPKPCSSSCLTCPPVLVLEEWNQPKGNSFLLQAGELSQILINHYRIEYFNNIWQPPDRGSVHPVFADNLFINELS